MIPLCELGASAQKSTADDRHWRRTISLAVEPKDVWERPVEPTEQAVGWRVRPPAAAGSRTADHTPLSPLRPKFHRRLTPSVVAATLRVTAVRMEALPAILETMQITLLVNAALAVFGLSVLALMLYRQSKALGAISKQVADMEELAAKAATALENVSRLVVHSGARS